MYYGGFTYFDAYNLPVHYRKFFLEQIKRTMTGINPNDDEPPPDAPIVRSRAMHHNTEEARAYQGKTRTNIPSRLIKFGEGH